MRPKRTSVVLSAGTGRDFFGATMIGIIARCSLFVVRYSPFAKPDALIVGGDSGGHRRWTGVSERLGALDLLPCEALDGTGIAYFGLIS
jgi:hypothetical protein